MPGTRPLLLGSLLVLLLLSAAGCEARRGGAAAKRRPNAADKRRAAAKGTPATAAAVAVPLAVSDLDGLSAREFDALAAEAQAGALQLPPLAALVNHWTGGRLPLFGDFTGSGVGARRQQLLLAALAAPAGSYDWRGPAGAGTQQGYGYTLLHYAAIAKCRAVLERLLELGADPTAPASGNGLTPLHLVLELYTDMNRLPRAWLSAAATGWGAALLPEKERRFDWPTLMELSPALAALYTEDPGERGRLLWLPAVELRAALNEVTAALLGKLLAAAGSVSWPSARLLFCCTPLFL